MMETPVPMLPPAQYRPLTPRIPLPTSPNSGSHLSQLSAPFFTEDRCSSISEEELEVDAEVTLINRRNKPNRTFTHNSTTGRPMSTPTTMDYTIQGDPNQVALSTHLNMFMSTTTKNQFLGTNNFFVPDGSNRRIVVLLHCGCLSLIPFIEYRIWNNSSSPDVLNAQASISISPKYVSKSKTTSHCHLLVHDCTNAAV